MLKGDGIGMLGTHESNNLDIHRCSLASGHDNCRIEMRLGEISSSDACTDGYEPSGFLRVAQEQHAVLPLVVVHLHPEHPDQREHLLDQSAGSHPIDHICRSSTALHKHNKTGHHSGMLSRR